MITGLRNRPELAREQELVEATILRLKQAKLPRSFRAWRSVMPAAGSAAVRALSSAILRRGDVAASLFWELNNLGFGDLAIYRRRRFENQTARLEKLKVEGQVAADVVAAYELKQAAAWQVKELRATAAR